MGYPESRKLTVRFGSGSIALSIVVCCGVVARAGIIPTSNQQGAATPGNLLIASPSTAADQIILDHSGSNHATLSDASTHSQANALDQWPVSSLITSPKSSSGLEDILIDPAPSLTAKPPAPSLQTTTSGGDAATAIPLPPAVQSGITGIAALAMAGLFRSIRRALR